MKRIVVAALLVSAGCAEGPEAGPIYQLLPVTRRDIVISASASGSVEPVMTIEVKSKASGEILEVRVETGDHVTRGQLLVRVDPRVPENSLMQATADLEVSQAQLANAQSELRRAEALFETQSITEQEYDAWAPSRIRNSNNLWSLLTGTPHSLSWYLTYKGWLPAHEHLFLSSALIASLLIQRREIALLGHWSPKSWLPR